MSFKKKKRKIMIRHNKEISAPPITSFSGGWRENLVWAARRRRRRRRRRRLIIDFPFPFLVAGSLTSLFSFLRLLSFSTRAMSKGSLGAGLSLNGTRHSHNAVQCFCCCCVGPIPLGDIAAECTVQYSPTIHSNLSRVVFTKDEDDATSTGLSHIT